MGPPARVTHMNSGINQVDPGSEPSAEELEILRLLAQGLTDEAIASRLGLPNRTYSRRLVMLWSKLGARSRFQAGVLACRRGWLSPSLEQGSTSNDRSEGEMG